MKWLIEVIAVLAVLILAVGCVLVQDVGRQDGGGQREAQRSGLLSRLLVDQAVRCR